MAADRRPSLMEAVASQISNVAPAVEEAVINVLVQRELKKRSDALVQGLDTVSKLQKDLVRIKPDVVAYNAGGTIVSENYSKGKLDELHAANKKLGKLNSAIDKALNNADFSDLYNLLSNKPDKSEAEVGSAE